MTPYDMVEEFHMRFRLPVGEVPQIISPERVKKRADLLQEELKETTDCMEAENIRGIADGLADLMYVVIGTALEYGIPLEKVFREVHRSNMTKLNGVGMPIIREDGKVMKSNLFEPPDLGPILDWRQWK